MAEARGRAFIGTSAWQKDAWNGTFYPSGLAKTKELAYFAARLSTVEVNSTYHGLQSPSTFLKWHDAVPEHFVFAVKAHGAITHERRLRGAEHEVAAFLASGPLLLREKLGPFLWQLPPTLAFDPELIDGFLAALPRSVDEARSFIARHGGQVDDELAKVPDRPLRHSMEVRHGSFVNERYLELLRRHGVAAVITNSTERPVIDAVTADFVYVRFEDTRRRFPEGQTPEDLEHHAARVRAWLAGAGPDGAGRDVFFYFDDPDYKTTPTDRPPFDAIALQRLVGAAPLVAGATLQTSLW
ncbi:DUF72 domain-containing protein [Gryllotalpicola protaetiae]|nr:DUF72 domain-containing protein [Gryllotalpicola protaetiae]